MRLTRLWLVLLAAMTLTAWPVADVAMAQDTGDDSSVVDDGTTDDGTTDDDGTADDDDATDDDGTADDDDATDDDATADDDDATADDDDATDDDATADDDDATADDDDATADDDDAADDDGTADDDDDATDDDGTADDDDDATDDDDGLDADDGSGLKIVPPKGRVLVGKDRRFRGVGGPSQGLSWVLADASDAGAALLDDTGRLSALAGGWAVIALEDPETLERVATSDTIWLAGGPTRVGRRGGRAFASADTFVSVAFPPNASQRALTVHIEKRGTNELPEQAKGRGTAVSVFEFDALDADTGEDVGGTEGFDEEVQLTLTYDDELIPEGIDEEDLVIATFDEAAEVWEEIVEDAVIEHDTENNTITVAVTHASFWAVMDGNTVAPPATAVESTSWGAVKRAIGR